MKILLELERHDCRFPVLCIGEAEGFCAEHVEGVDSYCAEHRRIAGGGRAAPRRERPEPVMSHGRSRAQCLVYGYDRDHEPDLIDLFGGRS